MKNFSELLATELTLDVMVNGVNTQIGLHDHMIFNADDTVTVDGIEVLPQYHCLATNGKLTISEPFYTWYHKISAQGWLLTPNQG
jgi:hypothetical protein